MEIQEKNNVIFTGFMGAGKTSAGRFYASHYHMPFIDTDQEIEKEAGMAISRIFADKGEEVFRKLETQCLEKLLKTTDGAVISVGGGLPLREENRELLKKLGLVVYLDVSPETVYKRIGQMCPAVLCFTVMMCRHGSEAYWMSGGHYI